MSADDCFITIAICTRNRADSLARAVATILPQLDERTELLIVDNGSTDSTSQVAAAMAQKDNRIRILQEPAPGAARARNTAILQARAKYVLFFDDDELAEPGWLAAYQRFFKQFSSARLGSVGGPYIAQHETTPPDWLRPDFGSFDLGGKKQKLTGKTGPAGGNCAYVKEAVLKIGGFGPALVRHEDSEINSRLREAGYEVWWLPSARVRHVIPTSRFRLSAQMRMWFAEGQAAVVVRWRSQKSAASRLGFILTRLLFAPFHAVLQVIGAVFYFLIGKRCASARLLFRACRTVGMINQIIHFSDFYSGDGQPSSNQRSPSMETAPLKSTSHLTEAGMHRK